jgi:hypothetical protein
LASESYKGKKISIRFRVGERMDDVNFKIDVVRQTDRQSVRQIDAHRGERSVPERGSHTPLPPQRLEAAQCVYRMQQIIE